MSERDQLEQAIAAQENLRSTLGDAVVEATIAVLRQRLAALEAQAADQERKLLTVLFADVSGFTALSETMDAEDVTDIMNALWTRLDAAITAQRGTIDKHIGDAIMALFGAQAVSEDDPERAIRAALTMQAELKAFAAGVAGHTVPLQMRIGINTGPALLGAVGTTGEITAMGDTVNLASRLEHAAPVGGILISHDTYRHVRGVFEVQPLPPLAVKGKVEPVQVYVVLRARPRAFRMATRGVEGVETRMIGRDDELTALQDTYRVAARGRTQRVTIVGEAGVGKSRLLFEFGSWLDSQAEQPRHFKGRATPEMTILPYGLIRNLLSFQFDILDSDSAAVARAKLERGLTEHLLGSTEEKAHQIGHLIGFDFSGSPYIQGSSIPVAVRYLLQFFTAVSEQQPTVIFLEDIHWADDRSLDMIQRLANELPEQRLLLVCLARPTLLERQPNWDEAQPNHRRLDLRPLSEADSRRLVDEILQKVDDIPDDLRQLIVSSAEGNPFYAEELVKMLIEDEVIVKEREGRWRVEGARLVHKRVPPTLVGVLEARLDSLPHHEKLLLQQASVVGRIFWDSAVAGLQAEPAEAVNDRFLMLRRRELIFGREESAFAGTQEYIFKHAILRDVTYESVLKRRRRQYHAQVAAWLVGHSGDRVSEYAGLIAEHYAHAGEVETAAQYFEQAARRSFEISAFEESMDFARRGIALLQENPGEASKGWQAKLTVWLWEGCIGLGQNDEARQHAETGLALCRAVGDDETTVRALTALTWVIGYMQGDTQEGKGYASAALELSRKMGDKLSTVYALNAMSWMSVNNLPEYEGYLREAVALARELDERYLVSVSLGNLGISAGDEGRYEEAQRLYEEALAISRAIGRRAGSVVALTNLGQLYVRQGKYDEAFGCAQESLAIAREIGDRRREANNLMLLAEITRQQGDPQSARQLAQDSVALQRISGSRQQMVDALCCLSEILKDLGRYGEAREALEEALLAIGEEDAPEETSVILSLYPWICLELGDKTAAKHSFLKGLDYLGTAFSIGLIASTLTLAARLLERQGETRAAVERLGFFLGDYRLPYEEHQKGEKFLDELRPALSPDEFQAALERGKELKLDAILDEIREQLARDDWL